MHRQHRVRQPFAGLFLILAVAALLILAGAGSLRAESAAPVAAPPVAAVVPPLAPVAAQSDPLSHPPTDHECRSCHGDNDEAVVFPSGEALSADVDLAAFDASVHGLQADNPIGCNGCHPPATYQYPHPPVEATDLRAYEISRSQTCVNCHEPHLTAHPGPDWSGGFDPAASESGMNVVCTDCHTSHAVQPAVVWLQHTATTVCADCHAAAGVALVDTNQLSDHVRAGLFGNRQVDSDFCMGCHGPPDKTMTFPNGDVVSISIDGEALHASVHGAGNEWQELECNDCHENYNYPHPPKNAASAREYTIEKTELCGRCHETQHEGQMNSVHAEALADGKLDAATCVDCHGAHDTPVPNEPRSRIPQMCRQCHSTIFDEYASSVHGAALLNEENPDVPTCIECHGVHNINDPTTALFRNRSPELCASCHANTELMNHYEISTDVFETYVDDFHGTTVTIFQSNDPSVATNKAVCYDCHGVHAIKDPQDPNAGIKENLVVTCQQCHPDATPNFSDAWTGHHRPSLQDNPLMFLVNIFYAVVIPATVGFFGFLVATDIYRRVRGR